MQSLSAKRLRELELREDFVAINRELESLGTASSASTADEVGIQARRQDLYWKKRQLINEEIKEQRKQQSWRPDSSESCANSRASYFDRVRKLDPPRDRLATNLFLDVPLRSEVGRSVLDDMISLCKGAPEVAYRPGMFPEGGCCPVSSCGIPIER